VRYFEMTDDGIPRFPVGIAIRNYEWLFLDSKRYNI
jgi:hypothetical protein